MGAQADDHGFPPPFCSHPFRAARKRHKQGTVSFSMVGSLSSPHRKMRQCSSDVSSMVADKLKRGTVSELIMTVGMEEGGTSEMLPSTEYEVCTAYD